MALTGIQKIVRSNKRIEEAKVEHEAKEKFRTFCEPAYLGKAKLNVLLSHNTLNFGTFNPGRQNQEDLLQYMAGMMKLGECHSESNPLTIAVDASLIKLETLTKEPKEPVPVGFKSARPVTLELLAGAHRVLAARRASTTLRRELQKLLKRQGSMELHRDDGEPSEEEDRPTLDLQHQAIVAAIKIQIENVKGVIELVEQWPVLFYDIGGSRPRH